MDELSKMYQLFLFLVYCHATLDETCMVEFPNLNEFTSSIKKATSFKNLDKPKRIDLILSNQPNCFQHSNIFEIGIFNIDVADAEFKMDFQIFHSSTPDLKGFKNTVFCIFNKNVNIKE